jgi:hypothetical protein
VQNAAKWAAAAVLLSTSLAANGALFSFSNEYSGSGDSCANTVCATLNVVQNGANVDFTLTGNLGTGEFITGLYGNWDPYQDAELKLSNANGTTNEDDSDLDGELDAIHAAASRYFDWGFDFSPKPERLDGVETFTWTFTGAAVDDLIGAISVDLDGPNDKPGFTFVLRVQGLGGENEGSGWFYSTTNGRVPEPGTLWLYALWR